MALTTAQMRIEWSEYLCNTKELISISVLNRAPVKTIKKLVEAWSAFEKVMYFHGYGNATYVSSYICKIIVSSGNYSMHAYRLANDVDAPQNWLQGNGATMDWNRCKLTKVQVNAVERIRTNSGAQVFRNGYVFYNPDPMHFQIACTQADIESGIDWSTVDGADGAPPPEIEEDDLYCKYEDGFGTTDGDENVKHWQVKLTALGFDTGGIDGRYGDMTKTAVIATVPGSDGLQILGFESGTIDVVLGKLGPAIPGGVEHQHPEYALVVHVHDVIGTAK